MTVNTQELRELLKKATPGPWKVVTREVMEDASVYPTHIVGGANGFQVCLMESPNLAKLAMDDPNGWLASDKAREANIAYIAATNPATVTALLDEIDTLRALVSELAENDTFETEYDGRMYSICHGCGAQDGEDHRRADCVYVRAQAVLNPPAPPQGETA